MERRHGRAGPGAAQAGNPARRPGDRLFFAVYPDAQAALRVVALADSMRSAHGLRGRSLRADRVHVTLHFLGDHAEFPEGLVLLARAAAAKVSMPPFDVSFDWVASFPGRPGKRPCVLRGGNADSNAPLLALQRALGDGLRDAGAGRYVERRFIPHVTLLYDQRALAPQPVPPIGWTVREFVLVHSLTGQGEHRVLARWPVGLRGELP